MWRPWLQQEVDGVLWCHAMQDFQIRYDSFVVHPITVMACISWPYNCFHDLMQSWLCGCVVDFHICHGGFNFSVRRWWSWTSCIPVKESTGGGIVDIASPRQLPLGIRRLLYWVCQGGNRLMKPKKHFAHQLSQAHMWRLVHCRCLYLQESCIGDSNKLNYHDIDLCRFPCFQEKWSKNLYIAAVSYGRTVS